MLKLLICSLLSFSAFGSTVEVFTTGQNIEAAKLNDNFQHINKKAMIQLNRFDAYSTVSPSNITWQESFFGHKITVSGATLSFAETGIYELSFNARNASDVWSRVMVRDSNNVIRGQSPDFGGSNANSATTFLFNVIDTSLNHFVVMQAPAGGTINIIKPAAGGTAKSIGVVIKKID